MTVMQGKNNSNKLLITNTDLPPKNVAGILQPQLQQTELPKQQTKLPRRKRLESMSDDEIIEENIKELLEKRNHDDRQANGRRVATVVAMLLIFVAVYHAWIRKSAMLAGALVPAFIMIGYGCWVVILAKRDKERRALFAKHVEEVSLKNKEVMKEKAKIKQQQKQAKENAAKMQLVNELRPPGENKRSSFRQKFFRQNQPTSFSTVANIHQLATSSLFSPALAIGTGIDLKPHVHTPTTPPNKNSPKISKDERRNLEREFSSTATTDTYIAFPDVNMKTSSP